MAASEKVESHVVGEKVLCFEPDESKARVLYNAKVIDAEEVKNELGKKIMEYKIHFQGWNSTWDRWADESFVLKDNEENRKLQRKLARRAIRKLKKSQKGKKRHHLPGVAGDVKRIPNDEDLGTDTSSDDESVTSSVAMSGRGIVSDTEEDVPPEKKKKWQLPETPVLSPAQHSESSSTDVTVHPSTPRRTNLIDIPHQLHRRLEDDKLMINSRQMLVKLPATKNVVQILENFVKYFAMNVSSADRIKTQLSSSQDQIPPEKRISLCQEVCADLRVLFDFSLPLLLLYIPERAQFRQIIKTVPTFPTTQHQVKKSHVPTRSTNYNEKIINEKCTANQINNQIPNNYNEHKNNNATPNHAHLHNGEVTTPKSSARKKTHHKKIKHERKTAEFDVIEETNKYLLPSPAMRDNTGLSNDSHGRRRSRRLSHCDALIHKLKEVECDDPTTVQHDKTTHNEDSLTNDSSCCISRTTSEIFLRKSQRYSKTTHGSNGMSKLAVYSVKNCCTGGGSYTPKIGWVDKNLSSEKVIEECGNIRFQYSKHVDKTNILSKEEFLDHAGSDINRIVELSRVWKWRILPSGFRPVDGSNTPPSLIYGIQHFLRMFVKLPEILSRMDIPDFKLKVIVKHIQCLLKFIKEYECELYDFDCYVTRL